MEFTRAEIKSDVIARITQDYQDVVANSIPPAHKQSQRTDWFLSFPSMTARKHFIQQTNSPAQLFADQLVIGCERVNTYPRVDCRHHSVFAHRC